MSDSGDSSTDTQQSDSYYANTGIQQPKPLRREVDEWYSDDDNEKQISLFFLAMARFQSMPVTDKLSYWQVAGK